jgi:aspartyl protease family protein
MLKFVIAIAAAVVVLAVSVPDLSERLTAFAKRDEPASTADGNAAAARVMLSADGRGHFEAPLHINGRPFKALVDTGASTIALTYEDGRELGLIRPGDRYDMKIQTANGQTGAKRVSLNSVRLGGISISNVEAMIAQEGALAVNLLGMSFLKKLGNFEIRNGRLILEQ